METCESTEEPPNRVLDGPTVDSENNVQNNESTESFQKFMYKLFEKNGILNDLRAYLRGHIVNVLRSAQTGVVPSCQKHFTQRLEHPSQALNMLIAEYFLRMEFSYSLSVFVSEIPLANMMFDFARSLMENSELTEGLLFTQKDVWSIINYLGVKCDSNYATKIVDMYKSENMSLLQCLLNCTPMYRKEPDYIEHESSDESLSSISLNYLDDKVRNVNKNKDKCIHTATCKICRSRFLRIRKRYKEKNIYLAKSAKETNLNSSNMKNLMLNISDLERKLIDEMFEQLKSVYETEVDMMKAEEEKKVKRSLATHSLQLQQKRDEMEKSFKVREQELERNLEQKKKFLWGLARTLREQHAQISRAQLTVCHEARRLCAKEDNIKIQLLDAEQILVKRADEMRNQISNELFILEGHLESMKRERETISRERSQLEQLRTMKEANCNVINIDNLEENADTRYDFLKNEFNILKKYIETAKVEPKCFMERSTLTDLNDVSSKLSFVLNNEQDSDRNYSRDEERGARTPNQVVNDFKKQKNVNFSQSNLDEIFRERSRDRSRSSASSDAGDAAARDSFERDRDRDRDRETIRQLRDENERLKALARARQQREHIEDVWTQPAPAPAPRADQPRPRTAPDLFYIHSSNSARTVIPNTFGWRKGAGEELSVFTNVPPRILLPGDPLPFIGVVRDRHADNRRHLISQWRSLRRRMSPVGAGRMRTCTTASTARDRVQRPCSAGPSVKSSSPARAQDAVQDKPLVPVLFDNTFPPSTCNNIEEEERPRTSVCMDTRKIREKSPKSLLREAKEKLRSNVTKDDPQTARGREKSPNAVLREAKLRLRKLEIEAEAVEKSYRDFRRRQTEIKSHNYCPANEEAVVTKDVDHLDVKRSASSRRIDFNEIPETSNSHNKEQIKSKTDLQTYIREYQSAFETHFDNRNTVFKTAKPIPEQFSPQTTRKTKDLNSRLNNFLETPLTEFRKFYQCEIPQRPLRIDDAQKGPANHLFKNSDGDNVKENSIQREEIERDAIKAKSNKEELEFEILKRNLNKIYNLQDEPTETPQLSNEGNITPEKTAVRQESEKNLLKIEVESVNDIQQLTTGSEPKNVLLVVETSVIENEEQSDDEEVMSANMTILISHKRSADNTDVERAKSPEKGRRSISPEQAARLTRNDVLDAIFHADTMKEASSIEMQLELSKEKEDSISEVERHPDDYPDDFSADVDNYNSRSEYENQSPVSIPKDDPFWDT